MGVYMGVRTGNRADIRRAVCRAPSILVLRVSRALELRIKLRVELQA
jgi:hypothetical protein